MAIGSLGAEARQATLRELLDREGTIDLATAADECGVSEMTIRRDLAELERHGLVKRVRGGAVAVQPERFERRMARNRSAKVRIAAKLAPMVPDSGLIAMDSSTTIHRLAQTMAPTQASAFVTGIETFQAVRSRVGRAILSGGEFEESTDALVGPAALRCLENYYFTRTFVSVSALDPEVGATDSTLESADLKIALRRRSDSLVLAVDSSKFGTSAAAVALALADVDVLVTDLNPDDPLLDPYRELVELA